MAVASDAPTGLNGTRSSPAPWTTTHEDSGTSRQAPCRSPSGSDTISRVSSESWCSVGLSGYWWRSVETSVLWNSEREQPVLE